MSEKLKMLTGKNPKDFESVAYDVINTPNVKLFEELVSQDEFLFDFVKQNVANRLAKYCNSSNYKNLLEFLEYYSPSYEGFIINALVKNNNDNLTNTMLNLLENGTVGQKNYCAKFFSEIKNLKAIELLNSYAYCEDYNLSTNCASALAQNHDTKSYKIALEKLASEDDFVKFDGVKFLVAYGNKSCVKDIITVLKSSTMSENIAGELLYLADLFEINEKSEEDALYTFNTIINGLGDIYSLSQVFDFKLYDYISMIISKNLTPSVATVLLNAQDKFNTLTENDEYLFDETKDTKSEILDIKNLLNNFDTSRLYELADKELKQDSLFVLTALDFTENEEAIKQLLTSSNPAIIIKSIETLKLIGALTNEDKQIALKSVNNENIKNIILAI